MATRYSQRASAKTAKPAPAAAVLYMSMQKRGGRTPDRESLHADYLDVAGIYRYTESAQVFAEARHRCTSTFL